MPLPTTISIGKLADRTGFAVSAIRYYEQKGLIHPERNAGGQRRFLRSDIRRLSFVKIAQQFGFSIEEIQEQLAGLPEQRTPTKADWTRISKTMRKKLDARIEILTKLRNNLDGCIGCGCLSMKTCNLLNPQDIAGKNGSGPRFLMGERPIVSEAS